jgi:hypothetical protein
MLRHFLTALFVLLCETLLISPARSALDRSSAAASGAPFLDAAQMARLLDEVTAAGASTAATTAPFPRLMVPAPRRSARPATSSMVETAEPSVEAPGTAEPADDVSDIPEQR